jgi:hypothetical protein
MSEIVQLAYDVQALLDELQDLPTSKRASMERKEKIDSMRKRLIVICAHREPEA